MARSSQVFCVTGSLLLIVTAVFHGTGIAELDDALTRSHAPEFLEGAILAVWVHFSIHLILLAFLGSIASFMARNARRMLAATASVAAVDAALVAYFVGYLAGVALLAAASLCFACGALLWITPSHHR